MKNEAETIEQYLAEQTAHDKTILENFIALCEKSLDKQFEAIMQYGMITYVVPLSVFPDGYHCRKMNLCRFSLLTYRKISSPFITWGCICKKICTMIL